jgi:hypothetical protein
MKKKTIKISRGQRLNEILFKTGLFDEPEGDEIIKLFRTGGITKTEYIFTEEEIRDLRFILDYAWHRQKDHGKLDHLWKQLRAMRKFIGCNVGKSFPQE